MIPCDTADIIKEYQILENELAQFNPELLVKPRLLAITKCDMIDEEMQSQMTALLPQGIPALFISAVSGSGIERLKDEIWKMLN